MLCNCCHLCLQIRLIHEIRPIYLLLAANEVTPFPSTRSTSGLPYPFGYTRNECIWAYDLPVVLRIVVSDLFLKLTVKVGRLCSSLCIQPCSCSELFGQIWNTVPIATILVCPSQSSFWGTWLEREVGMGAGEILLCPWLSVPLCYEA